MFDVFPPGHQLPFSVPAVHRLSCHNHSIHITVSVCSSSKGGRLGENTGDGGAEEHGDEAKTSLRDRLADDRSTGGSRATLSSGGTRSTASFLGGGGRCSSSGVILSSTAEDTAVVLALVGQAVRQLFLCLALGKAVDVAVVVVLHGTVALAAGVEHIGHVSGDSTGAGDIVGGNYPGGDASGGSRGGGGSGGGGHRVGR